MNQIETMNPFQLFFMGVEIFYNFLFYPLPEPFRVFAFVILMASIGKILSGKKGIWWILGNIAFVLFYVCYTIYKFGVINIIYDTAIDKVIDTTALIVVGASIVIFYWGKTWTIAGRRVLNYWTMWIFYWVFLIVYTLYEIFWLGSLDPGMWAVSIFFFGVIIILMVATRSLKKNGT